MDCPLIANMCKKRSVSTIVYSGESGFEDSSSIYLSGFSIDFVFMDQILALRKEDRRCRPKLRRLDLIQRLNDIQLSLLSRWPRPVCQNRRIGDLTLDIVTSPTL